MRSVILHCPPLGRDISGLLDAVPHTTVLIGERTSDGEDGCLEVHKRAIREAAAAYAPAVWVMEDDCELTKHFLMERWLHDIEWARRHRYDVLVGGSTRTYDERVVRKGMIEVSAFHSAHCVVYFSSGYEKALQAIKPLDWSLGRDCGMQCVVVHPFVAVQKPSFSGILQQDVNYVPLYEQHEAVLGALCT